MTAATGYKRVGLGLAAAVAAVAGVVAAAAFVVPADTVREAVKAEIKAVTGLDPILRGEASVSLFPYGTVSFADVLLGDDRSAQPAMTAEHLTAQLRLIPLFLGRIEIADISLVRPRIAVNFAKDGRSNWAGLIETVSRTLTPNAKRVDRLMSFSEIRVTDGTVVINDEQHDVAETLNAVELSLAWPSISKTFGATGRFAWRGEPIDASVSVGDLFAAIAGDRSGLKVRMNGNLLKVAFDGALSRKPTLKIEGNMAADADSLRKTLEWAGQKPLSGGGFERFSLKAQTNVVGGTVALAGVHVELDGNTAEGVLTFTADGRPTLQGTLAAEDFDATPYLSTIRVLTSNERDWSRLPIRLDGLSTFDLDMRLSAAKLSLSGTKLGRTAIAANLRNSRFTLTVGESQAFGGVLKGSVVLAKADPGAEVKANLQFADVDMESALLALFGIRRLEGKGNLTFNVEAAGAHVLALTRTINGTVTLNARQGALAGLNVEQLLRRLERRPLSGGGDFRSGRTPFEKLSVAIKIAQGTASVDDVRLEGSSVKLALDGSASIPARDLDLKGIASLVAATASDSGNVFELPFVVQGPWDDPIMLPDAQTLMERSGAAQRLLRPRQAIDALDAARAAGRELMGAGAPPAAAAPAAAPAVPSRPGAPAAASQPAVR